MRLPRGTPEVLEGHVGHDEIRQPKFAALPQRGSTAHQLRVAGKRGRFISAARMSGKSPLPGFHAPARAQALTEVEATGTSSVPGQAVSGVGEIRDQRLPARRFGPAGKLIRAAPEKAQHGKLVSGLREPPVRDRRRDRERDSETNLRFSAAALLGRSRPNAPPTGKFFPPTGRFLLPPKNLRDCFVASSVGQFLATGFPSAAAAKIQRELKRRPERFVPPAARRTENSQP